MLTSPVLWTELQLKPIQKVSQNYLRKMINPSCYVFAARLLNTNVAKINSENAPCWACFR